MPAAQLNYDSDRNSGNGITDGPGNGWNTTGTNTPWFNPLDSNLSAWNNANLDIAVFGGGSSGTAGTVTVGTVTAGGIIFNTPFLGNYTLSGGTITLGGTTPTITVNGTTAVPVVATINSVLTGTNGLIKNGAGNLTLSGSGANTYTGTTYVQGGFLYLNKSAGINAVGGDVIIDGGVLAWNQANMVPDSASITLISGGLQLSGLTETVANLTIQGGNANNNTSSNGGIFTVTGTLALTGASGLGLNSNGLWTLNKVDFTGATVATAVTLTGNGTVRATQFKVGEGGLIMTGQALNASRGTTAGALGSEYVIGGNVTASGTNNFNLSGSNAFGVARVNLPIISTWDIATGSQTNINLATFGEGGLIKTGAGRLVLAGAEHNTHTGMTTVSGGSLILNKTIGIDAIAGDITVNVGGILDWDRGDQLNDNVSIFLNGGSLKFDNQTETFKNLTQTAGTVNFNNDSNGAIVTITGLLRVSGGASINMNSGGVWTAGTSDFTNFPVTTAAISTNGNSTVRLTRFVVGEGGMTLNGQTIVLGRGTAETAYGSELTIEGDVNASNNNFINVGSGSTGVAQVNLGSEDRTFNITSGTTRSAANFMSFGGGLIKEGAGILELNAVNNYTGNTFINAGTLKIGANSGIDSSPIITVGAGGTLDISSISSFTIKPSQLLQGGGIVNGATIIGDGGFIAPGTPDSAPLQTLTISGNLTLASSSSATLQISSAGNDQIKVNGNLLHQNGSLIYVDAGEDFTPEQGQSFKLFDWTGLATFSTNIGPNYRDGSAEDGYDLYLPNLIGTGFVWDISQFISNGIIIVAVPEPSRLFFMLFAFGAILWRRRRSY